MISEKIKKGNLLIAEPSIIGDISFNRAVILLADHNEEGTVGFIMNKPLNYCLNDLIPEIKSDITIYNGGPVEQDNLYFIHNIPDLIPNSVEISNGIYWGGDFVQMKELINENKISENNIRFFLGYSGWDSSQLDLEINSKSWIVTNNIYKKSILGENLKDYWKEKIIEMGGDYLIWSNAPENPVYN